MGKLSNVLLLKQHKQNSLPFGQVMMVMDVLHVYHSTKIVENVSWQNVF